MKPPTDRDAEHTAPSVSEEAWIKKKQALLEILSEEREAQASERDRFTRESETLLREIERLENENHILAKSVKDFEPQLSIKRKTSGELLRRISNRKVERAEYFSKESDLTHETDMYRSEKETLSNTHAEISDKLKANVSALHRTVNSIHFVKGEIQTVMEKMAVLEGDVPGKFRDVDNVDVKITRAMEALAGLHGRMRRAEKDLKKSYYQNKNIEKEKP